jgi:RNA polymerase sigma factor (sigma-70 family)
VLAALPRRVAQMTDRPVAPDPDPLLAEILGIAARLPPEATDPHIDDPALLSLVDRAVAPYEAVLTPEGRQEARRMATYALATHPDIASVLERERAKLAQQGSGVRPSRSAGRLADVAHRRRGSGERWRPALRRPRLLARSSKRSSRGRCWRLERAPRRPGCPKASWSAPRSMPSRARYARTTRGRDGRRSPPTSGGGVHGELTDSVKIERLHHQREPLLDDLAQALPPGVEDDDLALARAAGVDAMVLDSPETSLLAREAQAVFDREVARMPPDERQFYELYFRRGLGKKKVAAELGISERTVSNRAAAIRARLTAALHGYTDDEE